MTLTMRPARPPMPAAWIHDKHTATRRGGVVRGLYGGYDAILLIRRPDGAENSVRPKGFVPRPSGRGFTVILFGDA